MRPETTKRIAVVVLGMHRSGTSALTRILGFLGCGMPANPLPAGRGNETGHWEPFPVMALNERILEASGSYAHDWVPVPSNRLAAAAASEFHDKGVEAIRNEFGDAPFFAIKDPRICRLFPFWKAVLDDLGAKPAVMIPIRNPLEVAQSLSTRDRFDTSWGYLAWLGHVLEAEHHSRGLTRHFSTYDQLLRDWKKVAADAGEMLGIQWPVPVDEAASDVEKFLSKDHRHHLSEPARVLENPDLPPWLKDVYAVMLRWAETGENASDYPALDRIRSEMAAAAGTFGGAVAAGWQAARRSLHLEQRESELGAARETAARLEESNRILEDTVSHRIAEIGHLTRLIEQREEETTALQDALAQTEATLQGVLAQAEAAQQEFERSEQESQSQILSMVREREKELDIILGNHREQIATLTADHERVLAEREETHANEASSLAASLDLARIEVADLKIRSSERNHRTMEALVGWDGWRFMPAAIRARLRRSIIDRTGLFDADFYRSHYPDVAAAGVDPLSHYVRYGAKEGRLWGRELVTLACEKAKRAESMRS